MRHKWKRSYNPYMKWKRSYDPYMTCVNCGCQATQQAIKRGACGECRPQPIEDLPIKRKDEDGMEEENKCCENCAFREWINHVDYEGYCKKTGYFLRTIEDRFCNQFEIKEE